MRLVHDDRAKPVLPEMPAPLVARVDASGIPPVRIGEALSQAVFMRRDDNKVDVIGHQTPGPDFALRLADGGDQHVQIGAIILVRKENGFTPIAPLGDMMGQTGNNNACKPSHDAMAIAPFDAMQEFRLLSP